MNRKSHSGADYLISFISFIALLSFCGCSASQSHQESHFRPETAAKQNAPYKVGLLCSLTGRYAQLGWKHVQTISDLVSKINSPGGINGRLVYLVGPSVEKPIPEQVRKLGLSSGSMINDKGQLTASWSSGRYVEYTDSLIYDTGYGDYAGPDKSRVILCATQLVEAGVTAILGPAFRAETVLLIPLTENAKVPLISFAEKPAFNARPEWVFSAAPTEAVEAIAAALKSVGDDRMGIRQHLETRYGGQGDNK